MDIKVLEKNKENMKLKIKNTNPAFMNAVRRIILSEVPVAAVNYVDFTSNSSAMYDETLAQRIGLVPLKFKTGDLKLPEECECESKGCPNCQVTLVLEKEGPGIVYSKDMKSTSKNVKPLYSNIPITELDKNQKIKLEAVVTLGKGKKHVKWQAGNASYKYYPKIEIDTKNCDLCGECVKSCPRNVLKKGKSKIIIKDIENCNICRECVENCKTNAIRVEGDENNFIMNVESTSGLTPEELFKQSLEVLRNKLKEVEKGIK